MTAVGRLFEEEKEKYGRDCRAEGLAVGEAKSLVRMIKKRMLSKGMTEAEACADLELDPMEYESAKNLVLYETVA